MLFRRGSRLEAPLVLDAAGATIGAVARDGFSKLPAYRQEHMLKTHGENQDSFVITPNCLAIADGVTTLDAGKATSQSVVEEMTSFLDDAGIAEQSPRRAKRTMDAAAAHADDVLYQLGLGGSATADVIARTADPNVFVGRHVGDSKAQQNRSGLVVYQTVPQSVRLPDGGEAVANTFAGRGRFGFWQAARAAVRFHVSPSLFMDQTRLLPVQPGDEFLLYSDGQQAFRGNRQIITPEMLAEESARHSTAAEAVGALVVFPETLAEQAEPAGSIIAKGDDIVVVSGRLSQA
jgi:serine/threonine protein phosphatase PrpC